MKRNSTTAALLALGMLLSLAAGLKAQTEIAGAVSGEWTQEGSPYIVVDSTWVPDGERLQLQPGSRVVFLENQGIFVFGQILATGTENDSVFIRVAENAEQWRGINLIGANQTRLDYASIVAPDSVLIIHPDHTISLNHCLIDAPTNAFTGDTQDGLARCNLTFNHTTLRTSTINLFYSPHL